MDPVDADEIARLAGTMRPVVSNWRRRARDLCICHQETGSHELCCGRPEGVNADCPVHGDGAQ